jgi:PKD repeat protein
MSICIPSVFADVDSHSGSLVLLVHGNQTAGSPTVFVDSSPSVKSITTSGDAITKTDVKVLGNASGYFDGTGDYLTLADSADWAFGTENFTISMWLNATALPTSGNKIFLVNQRVDGNNLKELTIKNIGGTYYLVYINIASSTTTINVTNPIVISTNEWNQFVLIRDANNFRMYENGIQIGSTVTDADSISNIAASLDIGRWSGGGQYYTGYIDEMAIWKNSTYQTPQVTDLYPQIDEIGFPRPVATFSGTPTSGNAPLSVTFTDASTNNPTSWLWDFGDGNSTDITEQNPVHLYVTDGSYTVSLQATNIHGPDWENKTGYITVGSVIDPLTMFTSDRWLVIFPLPIQFNDTSLNTPTAWNWSFGNGKYSDGRNATHQYVKRGRWTVTLNSSNAAGYNTNTSTVWILGG